MPDKPKGKKKPSKGAMAVYVVGGAVGLYLAYRLWQDHQANAAANGTTSGAPLLGGGGVGGSPGSSSSAPNPTPSPTGPKYSSLSGWMAAALDVMRKLGGGRYISGTEAHSGLRNFTNGVCVNQRQANAIAAVLNSIGAPPGINVPTIVLCKGTPPPTRHTDAGHTGHGQGASTPTGTGNRPVSPRNRRIDNIIDANRRRLNQMRAARPGRTPRTITPQQKKALGIAALVTPP